MPETPITYTNTTENDSDYYPGEDFSSSSESENEITSNKNKKNIIYTRKNDTIDKVCDLLTEINTLKYKLTKVEEDRDNLEEKLRMTIMELNTKNVSEIDTKKTLAIMKTDISKYRERIINIRNKALYRKHQVYILYVFLIISIVENIYHGFSEMVFSNVIKPTLYHIFYSKRIEVSVLKNLILCTCAIIAVFQYKNIPKK